MSAPTESSTRVRSPLQGTVVAIEVAAGDLVHERQSLLADEANVTNQPGEVFPAGKVRRDDHQSLQFTLLGDERVDERRKLGEIGGRQGARREDDDDAFSAEQFGFDHWLGAFGLESLDGKRIRISR